MDGLQLGLDWGLGWVGFLIYGMKLMVTSTVQQQQQWDAQNKLTNRKQAYPASSECADTHLNVQMHRPLPLLGAAREHQPPQCVEIAPAIVRWLAIERGGGCGWDSGTLAADQDSAR